MKKKKKHSGPLDERETRLRIFADCRKFYGPEAERQLRMVFDKWDNLLFKCTNEEEKKHISVMASAEVYSLMRYRDGLTVGGKIVFDKEKK